MLLSRGCEYGLQAILYLASLNSTKPVLQRDIAQALKIPNHFLGKILQILVRSGILISYKGKTGGFALAKNPNEIFPMQIVQSIDGENFLQNCILGFSGCTQKEPCPFHEQWKAIKGKILLLFKEKSIGELSQNLHGKLDTIESVYGKYCQCNWPISKDS